MSKEYDADNEKLGTLDTRIWRKYLSKILVFSDLELVSFIQSSPYFASLLLGINNLQIFALLAIEIKTTGLKSLGHSHLGEALKKILILEALTQDYQILYLVAYFAVNLLSLILFVLFKQLAQKDIMVRICKGFCYLFMVWYTLNIFLLSVPTFNLCAFFLAKAVSNFFSLQLLMGLVLLVIVPIQLEVFKVYNNDFKYYPVSLLRFTVGKTNTENEAAGLQTVLLPGCSDYSSDCSAAQPVRIQTR